jgi:mannose-6-phosphate isomerase-like protein (cupin superfamily)
MTRLAHVALLSMISVPGHSTLAAQGWVQPPLQWVASPSILPPGAQIVVVSGDPAAPGQSIIQLLMPDGYTMPPHHHPTDERVEVKEGTLLVGMGDKLDAKKTLPLSVGDTIVAPAGFHHYSIAEGATIVEVTFMGPYTITYVHDYQAPRQRTPLGN